MAKATKVQFFYFYKGELSKKSTGGKKRLRGSFPQSTLDADLCPVIVALLADFSHG
ncbi:MAG: hypothetical protein AAF998_16510 [Bacteroidota bacterium]